jgi:tetratricopeptide (TPR) repeat protein
LGKKSRQKKERARRPVPAKEKASARNIPLWALLVLALIAFLAFARAIPFEFVYDDEIQILRNPWIRSWENVTRFFTTDVWAFSRTEKISNYYRPFHMLVYSVGHTISGLSPEGYHVLNILLHCGCTLLVALIGFQLTGHRYASLAGALIFALHPIHAESVAWIAAVTDPLCGLFYFLALHLYLRDAQGNCNRAGLVLFPLCFFAALLSKEMAFTFPLVAVWLDRCLAGKIRWTRYLMLAGVFAVYAAMRIGALSRFAVQTDPFNLDLQSRIASTVVLLAEYTIKMFLPYEINPYHVFNPTTAIFSPGFAAGMAVLALFAAIAWWSRRDRATLFLFGYSVLTIVPVLNISGIGENLFADRYLYIPTLGSALLMPLLALKIWKSHHERIPWSGARAAAASLGVLLILFGWQLWTAVPMWRDTPTLYTSILKNSPTAMPIANDLGRYYFYQGDLEKAEDQFSTVLNLWDRSISRNEKILSDAYSGLGGIRYQQNRMDEAMEYFEKAFDLRPHDHSVLQNLGSVHVARQDYDSAVRYYGMALEINPRDEVTYNNLAAIYLTAREYQKALEQAEKALEIYPQYGDAYMNMARAYAAMGQKEAARRAYLNAERVDPAKSPIVREDLKALEETPP